MSIASELLALQTHITSAYGAVNNKGGTIPANKNMANLASAINTISGGGGGSDVVNAIIASFKAESGSIDANTFVEFVENLTKGTDTQLSSGTSVYENAKAVLIDTNKVFIAHRNGSYLYGVVCTIDGNTITAGTDTQLSTGTNSYQYVSAVLIDTNKVFIAHRNGSYLQGVVCTIDGNTITAGTDTRLSNSSGGYVGSSSTLVGTNKVFVTCSTTGLQGVVCTIDGNTITAGTATVITAGVNTYLDASAVLIDTNKVFIAHGNGNYLYGVVCTIDGYTITAGTDTQLSTGSHTKASAVLIDTNKVLILHAQGTSSSILCGVVCTIDGNTITAGTDTRLSTSQNSSVHFSAVLIGSNTFFIMCYGDSNHVLAGFTCIISGMKILAFPISSISNSTNANNYVSAVLIDTNKVFIAHRNTSSLYGIVVSVSDVTVKAPTSRQDVPIFGMTKTACTTSTAGEVWVLDYNAND